MSIELNIFERFLFEAPEDEIPPDMVNNNDPPDIPDGAENDEPPELDDNLSGDPDNINTGDDMPPDMPDEFSEEDFNNEEMGDDGSDNESEESNNNLKNIGLDDKVSAIMNMNLYQRFLSLLNTIGNQLTMIKNNSDILYTLSKDSLDTVESLKKLDENIRLYLKNSFLNENYSKNLLFFNKCLNLLKLLNDVFEGSVNKGIKTIG